MRRGDMTFTPHGGGGKPEIFAEIHGMPGPRKRDAPDMTVDSAGQPGAIGFRVPVRKREDVAG